MHTCRHMRIGNSYQKTKFKYFKRSGRIKSKTESTKKYILLFLDDTE